ncbi:MAG: hypothetical protein J5I91_01025 [Bacteroidetes bacterium]|nr:hypothetical protein [Bacteroidota bacterium]
MSKRIRKNSIAKEYRQAVFFLFLLLMTFSGAKASDYDTSVFNPLLRKMKLYSDSLRNSYNQKSRFLYNDSFKIALREFVETQGSFEVDADSINTVMFKRSPDKKVRAITWLIADNAGNYQSFGVIQYKNKKEIDNFWLSEKLGREKKELENIDLPSSEWTGGLIYQILEFKYKRKIRYLIMTFHGLDTKINRKTLDVMTIDDDGVVFGLPVFLRYEDDQDPDYRVLFNYSDQATMTLRYDAEMKLIVFDKLVPAAGFISGLDEFLIPDGTYSAYKPRRKGKWLRLEDFGKYIDLEK